MRSVLRHTQYSAATAFPLHLAIAARHASTTSSSARPLIAIGFGSADMGFGWQFPTAETVLLRKVMRENLNGNVASLQKMSPRELSDFAKDNFEKTNPAALMFPGSHHTISKFLIDEKSSPPAEPNLDSVNSVIKMFIACHCLVIGLPIIFSCDGSQYAAVALGGKSTPVPYEPIKDRRFVPHDGTYTTHNVTVLKGTWLHKLAEEVTPRRDDNGNVVLTEVSSTHPLIPTKLPDGAQVLATAPDDTFSMFSVSTRALAIVDHPEAYPPAIEQERRYEESGDRIPDSSFDGPNLWKKISECFVNAAKLPKHLRCDPIMPEKFSPRVQEIISARSWAEAASKQFAVSDRSMKR